SFWTGVLLAGGATRVPRWTHEPGVDRETPVADHETRVPDDLAAALERVAAELGAPPSALLLAAHAAVLGALSGDTEITTGYVARSEEHTSELQSREKLVCRLLPEKKK